MHTTGALTSVDPPLHALSRKSSHAFLSDWPGEKTTRLLVQNSLARSWLKIVWYKRTGVSQRRVALCAGAHGGNKLAWGERVKQRSEKLEKQGVGQLLSSTVSGSARVYNVAITCAAFQGAGEDGSMTSSFLPEVCISPRYINCSIIHTAFVHYCK